jgi:hypothetical protein
LRSVQSCNSSERRANEEREEEGHMRSPSRVKARNGSARTFWVWAGAVAFALGMQALPGFAQAQEEEPRVPSRGARPPSPENNPIPLPEPAAGQRPPSPEIDPVPMPEPAAVPEQEHAPRR